MTWNRSTRTRPIRSALAVGAVSGLMLLAACSGSETVTAENIGQRTAEAIREAETVRFEMRDDQQRFEGAIEYADGEVAAVELTTYEDDEVIRQEWWVEGDLWFAEGDTDPQRDRAENAESFVQGWDWARAQEDLAAGATEVAETGERDVDGVATTGYELTGPDRTETWWIDGDDRLIEYEYTTPDGHEGEGHLFDYGTELDITAP